MAGWLVSWPLNRVLRLVLPRVQRWRSTAPTAVYTRIVGRPAARQRARAAASTAACSCLTYWSFTGTPTGFIPPQDKGYLLVNVQLPDSASVERTAAGDAARSRRSPRKTPGVSHTVAIAGPVAPAERQRPELRLDVRDARRLPPPARAGAVGRRDRRAAAGRARRTRSATGWSTSSARRRSTAWARPAASRSSSRTAATPGLDALQNVADDDRRRRQPRRRACKDLFTSFRANTPWLYLDIDRDQGQDAGRLDRRPLQHAAGLPRLALRQRLQPLRPHLAGERPGRRQLPQADRRPQAAARSATIAGEMVPLGTLASVRDVSGPVMVMRYNMYPVRRRSTATRRRAPAPARRSTRWRASSQQELPPVDALRVDRAGAACSSRPATRPCSSSCWPSCSSSWCWRPSTRAGRCRWR